MAVTFLAVSFEERFSAKALGARWDATERLWYVPEGRDLSAFDAWLPRAKKATGELAKRAFVDHPVAARKGVQLSQLLAGVAAAVAAAHRTGVWTMVEVVQASLSRGHVYLEVSERDQDGTVLAKARAVIWARVAEVVLPAFEAATGAKIGPGIKLLVRAKPAFHAQHGFALEVDALDPEYTLGDLEARKREIRTRLQREGVFDANRRLAAPWDFNAVLVVAPPAAAGLGDFQAEARRLSDAGVCKFVYATSRFQGEGTANEIVAAWAMALRHRDAAHEMAFDAVVVIRGGGAVNDLAWLNDYALARCICDATVPVFTGIGHARDRTVLDEVAHTAFDTPSKVIAGIERGIRARAAEAQTFFDDVVNGSAKAVASAKAAVDRSHATVEGGARRQLSRARETTTAWVGAVRDGAHRSLRRASETTQDAVANVRHDAMALLANARQEVPALLAEVRVSAAAALQSAGARSTQAFGSVMERASNDVRRSTERTSIFMAAIADDAHSTIKQGRTASEALVREISGQGPEKTLGRGFAVVRSANGTTVSTAGQAAGAAALRLQFRDGFVDAHVDHEGHVA